MSTPTNTITLCVLAESKKEVVAKLEHLSLCYTSSTGSASTALPQEEEEVGDLPPSFSESELAFQLDQKYSTPVFTGISLALGKPTVTEELFGCDSHLEPPLNTVTYYDDLESHTRVRVTTEKKSILCGRYPSAPPDQEDYNRDEPNHWLNLQVGYTQKIIVSEFDIHLDRWIVHKEYTQDVYY